VLFENGGNKVEVINVENMNICSFEVPFEIHNIHLVSKDRWLAEDTRRK
jgi:hypothetical protein